MTAENAVHVRAREKWHLATDEPRPGEIETACGMTVTREGATDYSPLGDHPDELTGATVCYRCCRAVRELDSQRRQAEAGG